MQLESANNEIAGPDGFRRINVYTPTIRRTTPRRQRFVRGRVTREGRAVRLCSGNQSCRFVRGLIARVHRYRGEYEQRQGGEPHVATPLESRYQGLHFAAYGAVQSSIRPEPAPCWPARRGEGRYNLAM